MYTWYGGRDSKRDTQKLCIKIRPICFCFLIIFFSSRALCLRNVCELCMSFQLVILLFSYCPPDSDPAMHAKKYNLYIVIAALKYKDSIFPVLRAQYLVCNHRQ